MRYGAVQCIVQLIEKELVTAQNTVIYDLSCVISSRTCFQHETTQIILHFSHSVLL